jgi:hypothetical protein
MQSDAIFPTLAGRAWDCKTSSMWSTGLQSSQAMREVRISYASAPLYTIKLTHEVLRAGSARGDAIRADLDTLLDFFHGRQGRAQTFLFRHWYDNAVRSELVGTGDGATRSFPMGRTRGGRFEPIWWVDSSAPIVVGPCMWTSDGAPMWSTDSAPMYGGGYETTAATVSGGQLVLPSAPAVGQPVRVSATFFYRARFETDDLEVNNLMQGLWNGAVTLRATLGNKL